jgi:protein translocase SecG subunit
MSMSKILQFGQIIIAILLMVSILVQNRGSGLSDIFGGTGNVYLTKRGFEKKIFIATIVLAVLFFFVSLAAFIF